MTDLDLFFDSSRDVAKMPWQPIKVEKFGVFCRPIYFVALPFGNGLQYRNSDFERLDR